MGKSIKYTGATKFEKGVSGKRRRFFNLIMPNGNGTVQFGGINSFKFPVLQGVGFSRSLGVNTEINVEADGEYIVFTDLHVGSGDETASMQETASGFNVWQSFNNWG